jgi:hypothetical protein
MVFFLSTLAFMYAERKLGWACSRPLYSAPLSAVVPFGLFWGTTVAGSIRGFVLWQEPGAILRWVMGYALGAYVAIPNFGLLDEATVALEATPRHVLLKAVPLATYVACSIALAFLVR